MEQPSPYRLGNVPKVWKILLSDRCTAWCCECGRDCVSEKCVTAFITVIVVTNILAAL